MSALRDLYQDVIIDHGRKPRNFGHLAEANRSAEGFNPLCGDRLTLYLRVENGIIRAARFQGAGCAISTASASLMTEALRGKTEAEAAALAADFQALVTDGHAQADVGKLTVLAGVREFPSRIKCATLAWHTLRAALAGRQQPASTE
jgi:nitrogen fixation protein NifU and related proteins